MISNRRRMVCSPGMESWELRYGSLSPRCRFGFLFLLNAFFLWRLLLDFAVRAGHWQAGR